MENLQQRAAWSAFVWTIIVMIFAGVLVFWSVDRIPNTPSDSGVTAYAQALDLANQRLVDASNRIQSLEQQVNQTRAAAPAPAQNQAAPRNEQTGIDAKAAVDIAAQVAGRYQPITRPELVDFQGETAWAITYDPGIIYVRASDGQIIYVERTR